MKKKYILLVLNLLQVCSSTIIQENVQTAINSYQSSHKIFVPYTCFDTKSFVATITVDDQNFRLVLDIGSVQNSWIQSYECRLCDLGLNRFQKYIRCVDDYTISYKNQRFVGCITNGIFKFQETAISHHFLAIFEYKSPTYYGDPEYARNIDGVLSLGPNKANNIVNHLFIQNKIRHNVFSIQKKAYYDMYDDAKMEIGFDISKIKHDNVIFFPSLSQDYWIVELQNVEFNEFSVLSDSEGRLALFDSSVSSMYVPLKDFQRIFKYLKEQNQSCQIIPDSGIECYWHNATNHPILNFIFINKRATSIVLSLDSYVYQYFGNYHYGINPLEDMNMQNVWILGESFMNQNKYIFDLQELRIGIIIEEKHPQSQKNIGHIHEHKNILLKKKIPKKLQYPQQHLHQTNNPQETNKNSLPGFQIPQNMQNTIVGIVIILIIILISISLKKCKQIHTNYQEQQKNQNNKIVQL